LAIEGLLARLRAQLQVSPDALSSTARSEHVEREDQGEDEDTLDVPQPLARDPVLGVFELFWLTMRERVPFDPIPALLQMADFAKSVLLRRSASTERIKVLVADWSALAVLYLKPEVEDEILNVARTFIVLDAALDGQVTRGRRRLLHLMAEGGDPADVRPTEVPLAEALISASAGEAGFATTLKAIAEARTTFDDLVVLRDCVLRKAALPVLALVESDPEILLLRRYLDRGKHDMIVLLEKSIDHCPKHSLKLPSERSIRLHNHGLAMTECCNRILVNLRP
jgi:hypothetical protein